MKINWGKEIKAISTLGTKTKTQHRVQEDWVRSLNLEGGSLQRGPEIMLEKTKANQKRENDEREQEGVAVVIS